MKNTELKKQLEMLLKSNPKELEKMASNILKSETKKTDDKPFEVKDDKAIATYGMVMKISATFSNSESCPKDIKFGTIRGHFLQRLNDKKKPLTQGQVAKILSLKSLPATDLKSMRAYKKLSSI